MATIPRYPEYRETHPNLVREIKRIQDREPDLDRAEAEVRKLARRWDFKRDCHQ